MVFSTRVLVRSIGRPNLRLLAAMVLPPLAHRSGEAAQAQDDSSLHHHRSLRTRLAFSLILDVKFACSRFQMDFNVELT